MMKNGHVDTSLQLLAAGFISRQLAKLMVHLQGALTSEDIEDVHQARVACRRIRTALRLFGDCFDNKLVNAWEKQIKRLLKSFGVARDLDVQIEFLQCVLENLGKENQKMRPGIRRMMLRWKQRRDRAQIRVVKTIHRVQKKHLLTNVHIQMEKILFVLTPQKPSLTSPAVYQRAYDQIQLRIKEFIALESRLQNPEDIAGHHSLRIAAKKLRYAMEICNGALEGKLKSAIKKVKKIQTLLGDIHDCDVWDADINEFIEQENKRTIEFYNHARPFLRVLPGLLYLQQERSSHRQELYRQACEYCNRLNEESFWDTFPEVLRHTDSLEGKNQIDVKADENKETEESDIQNCDSV